jgi:hypothetical protein
LQVGVVQTQSQQHLKDIDIMKHNSSHSNEMSIVVLCRLNKLFRRMVGHHVGRMLEKTQREAVDAQELQDTAQTPERLANLGESFDTSQLEQMSDSTTTDQVLS